MCAPPAWQPAVLASGAYHYAADYARWARDTRRDHDTVVRELGRILAYRDGPDAAVAVREGPDGTRSLLIDGKSDAATLRDMRTQRLLGHLPAVLGPAPRSALVIGLGCGVTAGSLLAHPLERLDIVEILPAVAEAASFFSPDSRAPLRDRRTRLFLADARTHLAGTDRVYDLITSEPTNPWVAGAAALFTREFFARCRRALSPAGVMCQWLPAYHQSVDDFLAIVAAFRTAFPDATLWESYRGLDYLLIAGAGARAGAVDAARLARAFEDRVVASDLAEVEIRDVEDLLSRFVCGPEALRRLARAAVPVSDDRLELEFSGPRHVAAGLGGQAIAALLERAREDAGAMLASLPPGTARDLEARRLKEQALDRLRARDVQGAAGLLARARNAASGSGRPPAFLKGFFLSSVRERVARGDRAGALRDLEALATLLPGDPDVDNERGQVLIAGGDAGAARALYERLTARSADYVHGWRNLAVLASAAGDRAAAARALRRALLLAPHEPELHVLLAESLLEQGKLAEATAHYQRALGLDPAALAPKQRLRLIATALGRDPPALAQ
jgi:spermidine synthase/Flp pilus assembly protein TadD